MEDTVFARAVEFIDGGDVNAVRLLLDANPTLVSERRSGYSEGYFADPYLLWFVANNPIRVERMPGNIIELTRLIVERVKADAPSQQYQLDYALALVVSGRVPRETGVQLDLIDELVDAGADPNTLESALAHQETAAAEALLARGARLNLVAAACLDRADDLGRLAAAASAEELRTAMAGAAIYGQADSLRTLLAHGADPNQFCPEGFHAHSTPLHQAVFSGSLDAVKTLLDAGAEPSVRDRSFDSTALGWAEHGHQDEIARYLLDRGAH